MNRRAREILEKIEAAKKETLEPAREVLEHLYRGILAMPEFTLGNGMKARLDPYVEPEIGEDGRIHCGFDVLLDNGSHLEFMVENTGWGKALAALHANRTKTPGRGRE